MKVSEASGAKETTTALALAPCNNNRNIDFFGKRKIKDKEFPCERCSYIDCVCILNRYGPQDLSKSKD